MARGARRRRAARRRRRRRRAWGDGNQLAEQLDRAGLRRLGDPNDPLRAPRALGEHGREAINDPSAHLIARDDHERAVAVNRSQPQRIEPDIEQALTDDLGEPLPRSLPIPQINSTRRGQLQPERIDIYRHHPTALTATSRSEALLNQHPAGRGAPPRQGGLGGVLG